MMFYEIKCFSYKNVFREYEGSEKYKRFKEKPKGHIVVMSAVTRYN